MVLLRLKPHLQLRFNLLNNQADSERVTGNGSKLDGLWLWDLQQMQAEGPCGWAGNVLPLPLFHLKRVPHRPYIIPGHWNEFLCLSAAIYFSHTLTSSRGDEQQCNQWHLLAHPDWLREASQLDWQMSWGWESSQGRILGHHSWTGEKEPKARREPSHYQHHKETSFWWSSG